ncbi:MAG TPA: universal stress protein [Patescibacteria group bacterium]|nr:universal stress protein [Patescibacteria group bacterium]
MELFAPKEILCAVDLGPSSTLVLEWASLFARALAARADILHADWAEPPRYFTSSQIEAIAEESEKRKTKLREELSAMARQIFGPQAELAVEVVEGHPLSVLRQRTEDRHPDLVVLGSHGRSGVARLMLGSVAENVVRESAGPVLIARGGESAPASIRRILCPVSFSESARRCLETSAALASAFGAALEVLHADQGSGVSPETIHDRLCEWLPEKTRRECHITEIVRHGDAAEQIILQAREHAADLIVIGAEHRPLLEWSTLGTTAERVMRHSPCSVLVLPRGNTRP